MTGEGAVFSAPNERVSFGRLNHRDRGANDFAMEPACRIELLGGLRVVVRGQEIRRFRTRKTAELLAYLACRRRPQPREVLTELLWPECDPEDGRHSLSMALSSLRQQLEPPGVPDGAVLVADRFSIALSREAVTTDVHELEAALREAAGVDPPARTAALARAVELYAGELMPGHYEDWIVAEQQRLDELYFQALRQLIRDLEQAGKPEEALPLALRAVAANRLREETHRDVIRLYLQTGERDAALRHYRELERLLREELDCAPAPETQALLRTTGEARRPTDDGRPPTEDRRRTGARDLSNRKETEATAPPSVGGQTSAVGGRVPSGRSAVPGPPSPVGPEPVGPEPVGGAVPLGSRFYLEREADRELTSALSRGDTIVLVQGARQTGKTSLLARGVRHARQGLPEGAAVVLTDLQLLNGGQLGSADACLLALADSLAEQLDQAPDPAESWDSRRGASPSFQRYLRREILPRLDRRLVWILDGVDRLFGCPFHGEIFSLFRSWHDSRALDPGGPWRQVTLVMAYSTEAHLLITDPSQSPFNVGTRVYLEDLAPEQLGDLNARYGSPLRGADEERRFHRLTGGHPYLARLGLHEMSQRGVGLAALEERAGNEGWIFGAHLRRMLALLGREPELAQAVRALLAGETRLTPERFFRLRSAGVLAGESSREPRLRCGLYDEYLRRHLAGESP